MARTPTFIRKTNVVEALKDVDNISRFLKLQLVEAGFLQVTPVKSGNRGRPAFAFDLTGKAKGLLALSRNWKQKAA